jgi:hypothetical protein
MMTEKNTVGRSGKALRNVIAAAIAMLGFAWAANANLINPDGLLIQGQKEKDFFADKSYTLLFKAEYNDGVLQGTEADYGAYFTIVHPLNGNNNQAQISWNLTGSGAELFYVAWKDGRLASGADSTKAFLYSGVEDDQHLVGGPHEISTVPTFVGAFSHISFYGSPGIVPDGGGTLIMLGIGFTSLAFLRRIVRSRSVG